jgi:predicted transcriptional regulator
MRCLASALGRSPSGVHEELRGLVASGLITAVPSPQGTLVSFT